MRQSNEETGAFLPLQELAPSGRGVEVRNPPGSYLFVRAAIQKTWVNPRPFNNGSVPRRPEIRHHSLEVDDANLENSGAFFVTLIETARLGLFNSGCQSYEQLHVFIGAANVGVADRKD